MNNDHFRLRIGLLIVCACLCPSAGIATQETPAYPGELPGGTPVRVQSADLDEGWHLGEVGFSRNPRCTVVQLSDSFLLLVAVDSLEVGHVTDADTTWQPVSVAEILSKEPGCTPPKPPLAEIVMERLGTNPDVIRSQASLADLVMLGAGERSKQVSQFLEFFERFFEGGAGGGTTHGT